MVISFVFVRESLWLSWTSDISEYSCLAKARLEARTNPQRAMKHKQARVSSYPIHAGIVVSPLRGVGPPLIQRDSACSGICRCIRTWCWSWPGHLASLCCNRSITALWKSTGPGCSSPALDLRGGQRFEDLGKIHTSGWWSLHPITTGLLRTGIKVSPFCEGFGFPWMCLRLETWEALEVLKQFWWQASCPAASLLFLSCSKRLRLAGIWRVGSAQTERFFLFDVSSLRKINF